MQDKLRRLWDEQGMLWPFSSCLLDHPAEEATDMKISHFGYVRNTQRFQRTHVVQLANSEIIIVLDYLGQTHSTPQGFKIIEEGSVKWTIKK